VLDPIQAANSEARGRFHREARVTARIRSSSVVYIFDHGEWNGLPYIAMEYLEGEDLASRIAREGKLDPGQTSELVTKVARGLAHAHGSGVVHRDIKPENIFLASSDEGELVKILDFGIATRAARAAAADAQAGLFLGTPMYASPEQLSNLAVDHRTDLWSLAVVAFECLCGYPPFTGGSMDELCGRIRTQPLPRLQDDDPELPVALDEWLSRALAREREQRFQTAKELADAFAAAVGWARMSIPSLPPRAEAHSYHGELTLSAAPPEPKAPRRRHLVPLALALVLLLGVAVAYRQTRAGAASGNLPGAAASALSEPAFELGATRAPRVTVAEMPESLDDVCRGRAAAVTPEPGATVAPPATPALRKNRPRTSPNPAPPVGLEAWRKQPGF